MEEQALYRAILAAPHEDAPRLIYADWLDENADAFPAPLARAERARAEFIRLQCKIARLNTPGWGQVTPGAWSEPALAKRQQRLLFHHGRKWRRAFPVGFSSAPFDRGFLRPYRALRPQGFLNQLPLFASHYPALPPLPDDSPARRYVPEEPFAECPLWDLHLFASGWEGDPLADRGQHGKLLTEVACSEALARVGGLKLSFFQTPAVEFLRTGNFVNVETLVLNCVPFPEVLEAITENESFRSLRYVEFGTDRWAWAGNFPTLLRYSALEPKVREANSRHLPYGEMRLALRSILRDTPLVPVTPPPAPQMPPLTLPTPTATSSAAAEETGRAAGTALGVLVTVVLLIVRLNTSHPETSTPPSSPAFNMPAYEPIKIDPKLFERPKQPDFQTLLKQIREKKITPGSDPLRDYLLKLERDRKEREKWKRPPAVAPPPRPVERQDAPKEEPNVQIPDEK